MRKRELQEYYKVMFTEYPDVVNVEQLCPRACIVC